MLVISVSIVPALTSRPTKVLVEGSPCRHAWLLEFDHDPRQPVHEADQIRSAGIKRTSHTELADQQEVVIRWVLPVHYAKALCLLAAVFMVRHGDGDALLEEPIHLAVGRL